MDYPLVATAAALSYASNVREEDPTLISDGLNVRKKRSGGNLSNLLSIGNRKRMKGNAITLSGICVSIVSWLKISA
jgi:hypothetical protein